MFILYTLTNFVSTFRNLLGEYGYNFSYITFSGLALTVSLLLSHERASTNKLLQKKLVEVEALSEKNLAQEREKKQLLATQNQRGCCPTQLVTLELVAYL